MYKQQQQHVQPRPDKDVQTITTQQHVQDRPDKDVQTITTEQHVQDPDRTKMFKLIIQVVQLRR